MYGSERKGVIHIKNLNFDYCAIIIITILFVTTILRRMVKGKLNRCFIELLVVAWLTVFFDIWRSIWIIWELRRYFQSM